MQNYTKYREIKTKFKKYKDRPFDELYKEGRYESIDLIDKIIKDSYGIFYKSDKISSIPQA